MASGSSGVDGLRIVVVTTANGLGGAIARLLEARGAKVATLGEPPASGVSRHVEAELVSRGATRQAMDEAVVLLGGIDTLVQAAGLPDDASSGAIDSADIDEWINLSEGPVKRTLWAMQAARTRFGGGGRIVLVLPTIGVTGMRETTAASAAAEGQRIAGKIAARQWGKDGITTNFLLVSPEVSSPALADLELVKLTAECGTGFLPPALRPVGTTDIAADLGPLVSFLASADAGLITGQTFIADGGSWMVP